MLCIRSAGRILSPRCRQTQVVSVWQCWLLWHGAKWPLATQASFCKEHAEQEYQGNDLCEQRHRRWQIAWRWSECGRQLCNAESLSYTLPDMTHKN